MSAFFASDEWQVLLDNLPNLPFARHEDLRNRGRHLIHCGGRYDSRLLVPVIPEQQGS